VHEHVVVRLSIITHESKHFDLDRPVEATIGSDTKIAFLTTKTAIWDAEVELASVPVSFEIPEFCHNERYRLGLRMGSDTRLICCTRTNVCRLWTPAVDSLYGDTNVPNKLLKLDCHVRLAANREYGEC
jgi:hypothetical protein